MQNRTASKIEHRTGAKRCDNKELFFLAFKFYQVVVAIYSPGEIALLFLYFFNLLNLPEATTRFKRTLIGHKSKLCQLEFQYFFFWTWMSNIMMT